MSTSHDTHPSRSPLFFLVLSGLLLPLLSSSSVATQLLSWRGILRTSCFYVFRFVPSGTFSRTRRFLFLNAYSPSPPFSPSLNQDSYSSSLPLRLLFFLFVLYISGSLSLTFFFSKPFLCIINFPSFSLSVKFVFGFFAAFFFFSVKFACLFFFFSAQLKASVRENKL